MLIQDTTSSGWAFGGNWGVHFDATGRRILATEPQSKSLRIFGLDGKMQAELKGHLACIKKIRLVPGKELWIVCSVCKRISAIETLYQARFLRETKTICQNSSTCEGIPFQDRS